MTDIFFTESTIIDSNNKEFVSNKQCPKKKIVHNSYRECYYG